MTMSNSDSWEPSAKVASLPPPAVAKKKRNLPGMPDLDTEVIALSPRTLMATNRFVCEICNKLRFQRNQNLQLHRRGHNLPWKLRQRTNKDVKECTCFLNQVASRTTYFAIMAESCGRYRHVDWN
ncbi:hypothetical protein ZOSMA_336G00060 [Zostera marina]|uniref:C2H2-type domain-containing protein n=1 Tax=Zostera marina TaxID=29655 RepID=A0A0K9P858_ZOSMR|nr:hypothetical protein ZOSMA_336G00060 [Zostera marina]